MASLHSSHHSSRIGATTGALHTTTAPVITATYPPHMSSTVGAHQGTYTTTTHTTYNSLQGGDATPQAYISQLPQAETLSKVDIDNAYFGETRKVSSVVLEQQVIGEIPDKHPVRYVDVPVVEEQVKYVTRKEVVEVEKVVPRVIWDTVDKVVERPIVTYVDKTVEVPVEQIIEVPQVQVVEVTKEVEVPEYVPKVVYKEKIVEVPGPVVEVPKIVQMERSVIKPTPVDKHVPVVVAQTIKPLITESDRSIVVDVLDYEPEVVPVDVHVAKPVNSALELVGQLETRHRLVNITSAQYNSILRSLNTHMDSQMRSTLPFIAESGQVNFVPDANAQYIVAPLNIQIEGYTAPLEGAIGLSAVEVKTRDLPALSSTHGTVVESTTGGRKVACCGVIGDRQSGLMTTEFKTVETKSMGKLESTVSHTAESEVRHLGSAVMQQHTTTTTPLAQGISISGAAPLMASHTSMNVTTAAAPMTSVMRSSASARRSTQETNRQQAVTGSSFENVVREGGSIRSHVISAAAAPRSRVCC